MKQEQHVRTRRRRRRRRKPAEKKTPAKKKLQRPKEIKAGQLREHIKAGNLIPREVLEWLRNQPGPHSAKFIDWLRRKAKEQ